MLELNYNSRLVSAGGHQPHLGVFSHSFRLLRPTFMVERSFHPWLTGHVAWLLLPFCVRRVSSTSLDKPLASSQKLKVETVVDAVSFNGLPKVNPAPAPRQAIVPMARLECGSVATSFCYTFGIKNFITSVSFSCSSVARFISSLIKFTRSFNCVIKKPLSYELNKV